MTDGSFAGRLRHRGLCRTITTDFRQGFVYKQVAHGGIPRLFDGVRAPSTLGTLLRAFTHGHVQQLDVVGARLLAGLAGPAGQVPGSLAGGGTGQITFIDVEDAVREVYGYAKLAAAHGLQRRPRPQRAPGRTQ